MTDLSTPSEVKRLFDVYIETCNARLRAWNNLSSVEHSPVDTVGGCQSRLQASADLGDIYNEACRVLVKAEMELYAAIVNLPDDVVAE